MVLLETSARLRVCTSRCSSVCDSEKDELKKHDQGLLPVFRLFKPEGASSRGLGSTRSGRTQKRTAGILPVCHQALMAHDCERGEKRYSSVTSGGNKTQYITITVLRCSGPCKGAGAALQREPKCSTASLDTWLSWVC
eukprot:304588-Pyramimonas_sp.AAC.5